MGNLIVIEPLTTIYGKIAGDEDVMAECYGTYSVYCKAKTDNTININAQTTLVQKVKDVFPINTKHITATKPRELMRGADGNGFQVTQITFKLRTKFNARNE